LRVSQVVQPSRNVLEWRELGFPKMIRSGISKRSTLPARS
jgi:hypothetical protein